MLYSEIKDAALAYADRATDASILNNIDTFIRIVEARIAKKLRQIQATHRATMNTSSTTEYYELPDDFNGLVDIEVYASGSDDRCSLEYMPPQLMNKYVGLADSSDTPYYTIVANQLQVIPRQDGKVLEIVYYYKPEPLSDSVTSNSISVQNPELYIFGLAVEIAAFTKDGEALAIWEQRFTTELDTLEDIEKTVKWGGPLMAIIAEER